MTDTMSDERITAEGPVRWEQGGTAQVREAKDTDVVLRSSVPFPPGKPARGTLEIEGGPMAFTVKVARSQRAAEGVWDVRGRLISAPSALRAAFAASLARSS
jgi:hypothetical protein